ncbi:MAG: hypothetical protein IT432_07765 [Phycisphaerales bacterium]|nr:hypothetical protein [Phycisphaerales bacterium]
MKKAAVNKRCALMVLATLAFMGVLAGVGVGSAARDVEVVAWSLWFAMSLWTSIRWSDVQVHKAATWHIAAIASLGVGMSILINAQSSPQWSQSGAYMIWTATPALLLTLLQISLLMRILIASPSPIWWRSMAYSLAATAALLAVTFFWAARGLVIPGVSDFTDLDGWLAGGHQPLVSRDAAWRGVIWTSITLALVGSLWRPRKRAATPTS